MQINLRPLLIFFCAVGFCSAGTVRAQQTVPTEAPAAGLPAPDGDSEASASTISTASSGRLQLVAAKSRWADLLREHIPEFANNAEAQNITPALIKRLRLDISNILSTEGYFSPQIQFDNPDQAAAPGTASKIIRVTVEAGPRTVIENVSLKVLGPMADAIDAGDKAVTKRRRALQEDWGLAVGQPFRENDWSDSKNQLLESLRSDTYAAAGMTFSEAKINADQHSAVLKVDVDSGPVFTLGEMRVTGLQRYPSWLIERYQAPRKGEVYSRSRLLDFQRSLQNSPYFATVAVGIDPDPEKADAVPVDVTVVERQARDLSFGLGYSTNTGYRSEVAYRDRNILDQAWDLRSAVRLEQRRQLGYVDIYLPPRESKFLDSFGVLVERENIAGVRSSRSALGVKRTSTRGHLEQRLGLNIVREKISPDGEAEEVNKALVASIGWTWRDVDQPFDPRKGQILQFDLAASEKALLSDQRFIRSYAKYQRWIPVRKTDTVILRAELGAVFSKDEEGIPEDYLFRTGGSTTVRGYGYQTLGIQHIGSTRGGRVMATASAEYVHWLNSSWGAATFLDVGNAADNWRELNLKQGMGVGARYKTPAGPIALDLAYGRQAKKVRLDFSIAIAF
ncbi:autotransporter assembly complex protein TamA [Undibacterium umbellatum]|uniref:BamA/TamA family outer membrane protein n=1 Tax=Undibacterium umbellatum TaxID=2762300 RepID=A0ABR6ZI10_9BURK|nr:BamA/TamA family outer membrane protein [Undibacterium umbellatum]MBC3911358.1 BamA/TamA family outer membrane protein [Undibacterium umbellatum]